MKKILTICVIVCLLLSISACGSEVPQDPEPSDTDLPNDTMVDTQYKETYYPFSGGYQVVDVARIENQLLILGQRIEEDAETGSIPFKALSLD